MKSTTSLIQRLVSRVNKTKKEKSRTVGRVSRKQFAEFVSLKKDISEQTIQRYWANVSRFLDWLGDREINEQTLGRYNAGLKRRYSQNSRIPVNTSINWLLAMLRTKDSDGEPLRLRIPTKETSPHGRLVSESEWQEIRRYTGMRSELRECVLVHLLRETLLRPSDLVRVRVSDLDLEANSPAIHLVQEKTKFAASPRITHETGQMVKKYLKTYRPLDYLFEPKPGNRFHRQWPAEVLRRVTRALGIPGITPRVFRRTGATAWEGRIATLQLQGGWKDPKTIYQHYLKYRAADHIKDFEATFEKATKRSDDPGYFA